ncbi:unnamed protein product [Amoebophrya sp. A25]|nr:unnamed protein product [Amoebophrya sp. A25]|eukprot:GSA25T00024650001.1
MIYSSISVLLIKETRGHVRVVQTKVIGIKIKMALLPSLVFALLCIRGAVVPFCDARAPAAAHNGEATFERPIGIEVKLEDKRVRAVGDVTARPLLPRERPDCARGDDEASSCVSRDRPENQNEPAQDRSLGITPFPVEAARPPFQHHTNDNR